MTNPMSMMPVGFNPVPSPAASLPICRMESMMLSAKSGPLVSSHQKNPVKIVNRTNSAKNSPRSAFRNAIMPNVQTMLIVTSVQNSVDAWPRIVPAQVFAAAWYFPNTSSKTPVSSAAAALAEYSSAATASEQHPGRRSPFMAMPTSSCRARW
jgi:hypothetical protein